MKKPEKLALGRQAPFVGYYPELREWPRQWHCCNERYWGKPFERFFERLGYRVYRAGPIPWAPGRYRTSRWHRGDFGCFSGIRETLEGAYHAERYTGVRKRPEDYLIGRDTPEQIASRKVKDWRQRSWRMAA